MCRSEKCSLMKAISNKSIFHKSLIYKFLNHKSLLHNFLYHKYIFNKSIVIKTFLILFVLYLLNFCFFSFEDINNEVSLTFAGDAIPHFMIRSILDYKGEKGILNAFYFVKKYMNSDISFFNLETTITDKPNPVQPYHFSVEPLFLNAILKSGFTHYTIANNHSLDFGENGFEKTLLFIDKNSCTGFSEDGQISYLIFNINGIRIAFFSFTTLSNYPVEVKYKNKPVYIENCFTNQLLLNLIEKLDEESDLLITGIHWGAEYNLYPDELQKRIAKFLIDKGVDIIWGSHPHVVQPFEIYNDRLILYSCGNLISGQAYNVASKEKSDFHKNYFYTRAIPIIKVLFNKDQKIKKVELIPFFQINNYFIRKKGDSYFTALLPTKYFKKGTNNYQNIFVNYLQNDEDIKESQDLQNKGEYFSFLEYIKLNFMDNNTMNNVVQANNILYETFFQIFIKDEKLNSNDKLKQKIVETDYSYILNK